MRLEVNLEREEVLHKVTTFYGELHLRVQLAVEYQVADLDLGDSDLVWIRGRLVRVVELDPEDGVRWQCPRGPALLVKLFVEEWRSMRLLEGDNHWANNEQSD